MPNPLPIIAMPDIIKNPMILHVTHEVPNAIILHATEDEVHNPIVLNAVED